MQPRIYTVQGADGDHWIAAWHAGDVVRHRILGSVWPGDGIAPWGALDRTGAIARARQLACTRAQLPAPAPARGGWAELVTVLQRIAARR